MDRSTILKVFFYTSYIPNAPNVFILFYCPVLDQWTNLLTAVMEGLIWRTLVDQTNQSDDVSFECFSLVKTQVVCLCVLGYYLIFPEVLDEQR